MNLVYFSFANQCKASVFDPPSPEDILIRTPIRSPILTSIESPLGPACDVISLSHIPAHVGELGHEMVVGLGHESPQHFQRGASIAQNSCCKGIEIRNLPFSLATDIIIKGVQALHRTIGRVAS